jgi:hypothetical protein
MEGGQGFIPAERRSPRVRSDCVSRGTNTPRLVSPDEARGDDAYGGTWCAAPGEKSDLGPRPLLATKHQGHHDDLEKGTEAEDCPDGVAMQLTTGGELPGLHPEERAGSDEQSHAECTRRSPRAP